MDTSNTAMAVRPKSILWRLPTPQNTGWRESDPPNENSVEFIKNRIRERIRQRMLQAEAYQEFYSQFKSPSESNVPRDDDRVEIPKSRKRNRPQPVHGGCGPEQKGLADADCQEERKTKDEPGGWLETRKLDTPGVLRKDSSGRGGGNTAEFVWLSHAKRVSSRREACRERLQSFIKSTCFPSELGDLFPGRLIQQQALPVNMRQVLLEHVSGTEGASTWNGHHERKTKVTSPSAVSVVSTAASWGPYATSKHLARVEAQVRKQQAFENHKAEAAEGGLMAWEDKYGKLLGAVKESNAAVEDLKEYYVFKRLFGHLPLWMIRQGGLGTTMYGRCYTRLPGRRYRRRVIAAALSIQAWWAMWIVVRRRKKEDASRFVQRIYRGHKGREVYHATEARAQRLQQLLLQVHSETKLHTFRRWRRYTDKSLAVKAARERIRLRILNSNLSALRDAARAQRLEREARYHLLVERLKVQRRRLLWSVWVKYVHDEKILRKFLKEMSTRMERRAFVSWIQFLNAMKSLRTSLAEKTVVSASGEAMRTVAEAILSKRRHYYRHRAIRLRKAYENKVLLCAKPLATTFVESVLPIGLRKASRETWLIRHRNNCARKIQTLFHTTRFRVSSYSLLETRIGQVIEKRWVSRELRYYYVNSLNGHRTITRPVLLDMLSARQNKRLDCLSPFSLEKRRDELVSQRLVEEEKQMQGEEEDVSKVPSLFKAVRTKRKLIKAHLGSDKGSSWVAQSRLEDWGTPIRPFTPEELEAAQALQRMFRVKLARDRIRDMCRSITEKHFDPHSGVYYFYNTKTGESSWEKPKFYEEEVVKEEPKVDLPSSAFNYGPLGAQAQMLHKQQMQFQAQLLQAQMMQNQFLQAQLQQRQFVASNQHYGQQSFQHFQPNMAQYPYSQ